MTKTDSNTACPRCGEPVSGKFCAACGSALSAQACPSCGRDIGAGARFCQHCGASAVPNAAAPRGMPPAWMIAAAVLTVLVAFIAGQQFGTRAAVPEASSGAPFAPFAGGGGGGNAPDISNMSAEEAASRLFDRVMRYSSEGKADSAAMFAPMALMAYERIGTIDAHARYDMGSISVVTGDGPTAAAQADTILKSNPTHLLGLLLAAKAADLEKKTAAAAGFRSRFSAALASERAKNLPEYQDHQRDIDTAAPGQSKSRP
jgi:hypothetical protein